MRGSYHFVNPSGLFAPQTYAQVAIGTGSKLIFISGQLALDTQGQLVGIGDLAKLTVYVVDWTPDKMEQLVAR